ncbi:Bug family tripartite tricarboxylate transporter substrate binding protein [Ottowia thiooxydans]|uniref:Tripartite-type tricarboxylate transporter receptor subunit TctC n=1 Tax=Ottowia thiooxydans TaxID=219182 RepID=A0ABV2Q4R7_9BURK
MKRRSFLHAGALALPLITAGGAWAQSYPTRNVRIVVPVAAGGSADKLARILAQQLSEQWKHSVVVENVPGASGAIGTLQVVRAPGDGHTLLLGGDQLAVSLAIGSQLAYDARKDLKGIVKAVVNPQLLVARPGLGVKDFAGYVDLLKKRPGEVTLALPGGKGSLQHLAVEMLNARLGLRTNNIPYPGGGPATLDVLGGHIDTMLITLAAATQNVRSGKLVALAVTTPTRSKALPEVPTLQELGVAGYVVESWQGLLAPAATPSALIAQLNRDVVGVLRRPDITAQLEDLGFNLSAGTSAEVDKTIAEDATAYKKVVQQANIQST